MFVVLQVPATHASCDTRLSVLEAACWRRIVKDTQLTRARDLVTGRSPLKKELTHFLGLIENTPKTHTVRGMYVGGLVQAVQAMGFHPWKDEKIHAFREYSLREYMEMLLDAAISLYPADSVREGLRKLGGLAIPTFSKSMAGGVIMATVGRSWDLALICVSRGYEVSLKPGKAIVMENANGHAMVQLRNVWNFADCYQVGVMEGLMHWCKLEGKVTPEVHTPCDVDLKIEWEATRSVSKRPQRDDSAGASASIR
jgi:uncharacterized protein (TIGR02265 family)